MSQEPLNLTEDSKEVAAKAVKKIYEAAADMHQMIKDGTLDAEMGTTFLSLITIHSSNAAGTLDIPSESKRFIDERSRKIRSLNEENSKLKKMLGQGVTSEAAGQKLTSLSEKLNDFWDLRGFGHISSIEYSAEYGEASCTVDFSCMLTNYDSLMSKTPATDRDSRIKWFEDLEERGFKLVDEDDSRRERCLLDSDGNREILIKEFKSALPGSRVRKFENRMYKGSVIMTDVVLSIPELGIIEALPEPKNEANP